MSHLYQAELTPSKGELLATWIPTQPWATGLDTSALEPVGAYRYDDPAGAVGIETHLVAAPDGTVFHVPLTYRDAPLAGAEAFLIDTMDHSVLGTRWCYDAVGDPVYLSVTARAIVDGAEQAEVIVEAADGTTARREPTTFVGGSGTESGTRSGTESGSSAPGTDVGQLESPTVEQIGPDTVVRAGNVTLLVHRVVDATPSETPHLAGTWPGRETKAELVVLRT